MFLIKMLKKRPQIVDLLDEPGFRQAVDEERMRADRNGRHFALVVFECGGRDWESRSRRFAEVCRRRLRTIDRAGFLSSHQVALLLPGTGASGAQKVAGDIASNMPGEGELSPCTIYVYPENAIPACPDDSLETAPAAIHAAEEVLVEPLPFWKRALDVVGASLGMLAAAPFMIAAAIAIKFDSAGPVLFTQVRAGLGGRPFKIYKFRTMTVGAEEQKHALRANSEQDGPAFKMKHDPRITRVGKYLRRTCIDELPQFWNVLKGDMSLVGPRPLPCDESDECEAWQRRRLLVTPGLTCIWQVSGGMRIPFVEWMRMDIRYIRSRRLLHDLKLLWATLIAVVFHRASH
jgi:lipopolysaccharide/colanic/teichoic acid biosynthesis glycosyltransferase